MNNPNDVLTNTPPKPGILEDDKGNPSSTRMVFTVWAFAVLAVWVIISLKETQLMALDDSLMYVLGILMTGKVGQKFAEK